LPAFSSSFAVVAVFASGGLVVEFASAAGAYLEFASVDQRLPARSSLVVDRVADLLP
jgi:hypothetical protein